MKIHYHTDCSFFAGCENILTNLLNNEMILSNYEVSYSFPSFSYYRSEADKRIKSDIHRFPLFLPDFSKLNYWLFHKIRNKYLRKIIVAPIYYLEQTYIFMFYDIIRLFILFKKVQPDILHINNGGYPAAVSCRAAVIAAKYANVRMIIFHVNNIAENVSDYNPIKKIIEKKIDCFVKNNINIFITGSNFARLKLAENRDFNLNQIVNIPNTIIPRKIVESPESIKQRLKLSNEDIVFGNVALLTERKGHTVLIDAFNLLRDKVHEYDKVKLVIEGTGEEEQKLKNIVASLKLNNNILLIGSQEHIFDIYNIFDVFVLSSISNEDMPNVIIEAMSLGKPIIGTNLAGIPEEIENNVNGFIVNVNNAEDLSEAMLKFIVDKNLIQKMGIKSKEIFDNKFEYSEIIKSFINLYDT
jgi:glycosyltransferase involved in cell wall biosynthesis